ncbi:S-layer homology domain-containing protein [Paenibacillus sp. GCM10012307]|uniref:S-layer homology domain-containing protein n=1 Tax=Paenibacillus roseus TaxID=2798579 RepID=A0A934MQS0_9BACL|nr:S-layer homology domain-containing protein [Paenibacillus roseus]MBJ6361614.1 S-layer homology domain-containing protein [Paenibacillus roseus]
MKKIKLWSASMVVLWALLVGSMPLHAAGASDIRGHWAEKSLQEWLDKGWLTGYKDGTVKPNKAVTRAELAAMINKAFELKGTSDAKFSDLPPAHWARNAIATAISNGYLKGTGGDKVSPDRPAARQEAAVMLAKLIKDSETEPAELPGFKDREQIASWSASAIAFLNSTNVMKGDTTNLFRPTAPLTRAEAVVAINNALLFHQSSSNVEYTKQGIYGPEKGTQTIAGNAVIKSPTVTLKNVIIRGDLIIAKEVGEGDVTLINVTVLGTTTINGGGPNSIHVQDSKLDLVFVNKQGGKVRLVASGSSIIANLVLQSSSKVENTNETPGSIGKIIIDSVFPSQGELQFQGNFEKIDVLGSGVKLRASKATINHLVVDKNAKDNIFDLDKTSSVKRLDLNAKSSFTGEGKIETAQISKAAESSTFSVKPLALLKDNQSGGNGGGGFPGGGGGGGTPGGGPNPGNGTSSSLLSELIVEGSTLLQLDEEDETVVGKGFKSTSYQYEALVPVNGPQQSQSIHWTPASGTAKVHVRIAHSDGTKKELTLDPKSIYSLDIPLKLKQDTYVYLNIETDSSQSFYYVYMKNSMILQDGIKVETNHYYTSDGQLVFNPSSLISKRFNTGDIVTVSHNAQTIATCKVVYLGFLNCPLLLQQEQGEIDLDVAVVKYSGEKLQFTYNYNAQPLKKLSQDSDLGITLLKTAELELLDQELTESGIQHVSGISFKWDTGTKNFIPEGTKYYSINVEDTKGKNPKPYIPTVDESKVLPNQIYLLNSADLEHNPELNGQWAERNGMPAPILVYDKYAYVFFYDQDRKPLGYVVQLIQLDQNHVGEGTKAMRNTQDEYDEDLDVSLGELVLEGFPLSNSDGEPLEFDPDMTFYYVPVTDSRALKSISVRVSKSPKATVSYKVYYRDAESESEMKRATGNAFQIELDAPEISHIQFKVETKFVERNYRVEFMHEYDFQKTSHIGITYADHPVTGEFGPIYFFTSGFFQNGEFFNFYKNENDQVELYRCDPWRCYLPKELLNPTGPGTFYVSIERNGEKGRKLEYSYDLTPLQRFQSDQVSMKRLTKTELQQRDLPDNFAWPKITWYGWQVNWDRGKERNSLLRKAEYYSLTRQAFNGVPTNPYPLVKQQATSPRKLQDGKLQDEVISSSLQSNASNQYIYVILYDAQKNPIGYIVQGQNFDPDYSYVQERSDIGTGPDLPNGPSPVV